MRKLLVTGAHGQLGSQMMRLAALHPDIDSCVGVGSSQLDITDQDAVDAAVEAGSIVVNCAAYTAVDAAESDEDGAMRINERGPANLAAACGRVGARLIHVSTDYVFAGDASVPYEPSDPVGPRTVYGATKLAGERAVQRVLPDALIVRTAWVYTGIGSDFVATMLRLERERETVSRGRRSTWFADVRCGFGVRSTRSCRAGLHWETVHLTNAGQCTWFDLAQATFAAVGADPARVLPVTSAEFVRPAPRPPYSVLSGAAWEASGLTPLRPWRDALIEAVRSAQ